MQETEFDHNKDFCPWVMTLSPAYFGDFMTLERSDRQVQEFQQDGGEAAVLLPDASPEVLCWTAEKDQEASLRCFVEAPSRSSARERKGRYAQPLHETHRHTEYGIHPSILILRRDNSHASLMTTKIVQEQTRRLRK